MLNSNNASKYVTPKDNKKAKGGSDYKKTNLDQFAQALAETPIAKLYLILLMVVFAIAIYSKGKAGIENSDVALIIFFSLFAIVSIILLEISTIIKRELFEELKYHHPIHRSIQEFFSKYFISIFFSIGLFLTLASAIYYSGKAIAVLLRLTEKLIK